MDDDSYAVYTIATKIKSDSTNKEIRDELVNNRGLAQQQALVIKIMDRIVTRMSDLCLLDCAVGGDNLIRVELIVDKMMSHDDDPSMWQKANKFHFAFYG